MSASSSSTFSSIRCLSPEEEQSREPGEVAGQTMDSLCSLGCFTMEWVLPFSASALSLTVHYNALNRGISIGLSCPPSEVCPGFPEALFEQSVTALVNGALVVTCLRVLMHFLILLHQPPARSFKFRCGFSPMSIPEDESCICHGLCSVFAFSVILSLTVHQSFIRESPSSFSSPFSFPVDMSWHQILRTNDKDDQRYEPAFSISPNK